MSVIYFTEQGGYLRKYGETITFEKDGETLLQRPIKDVKIIVLFGNIQVSVQALLALLEAGCDISMMTQDGHFRGRMTSALGKNSPLRQNQIMFTTNHEFRMNIAKAIVTGKLKNGIALLKRYTYSNFNPMTAERLENIQSIITKIETCKDLDSLRGLEGSAARLYFEDFSKCFTGDIPFTGRLFFPAPDPINATLSFGYSFISRELQGILDALGLDPYIGYFHQIKYGRASLSLDLTEEFRHAIVDRLTLKLFNKKILDKDDFYSDSPKGGCYLKRESLKIYLKHYEEYMNEENITYSAKDKSSFRGKETTDKIDTKEFTTSYRKILWKQAEKLKNAIENAGFYQPFLLQ